MYKKKGRKRDLSLEIPNRLKFLEILKYLTKLRICCSLNSYIERRLGAQDYFEPVNSGVCGILESLLL